MSGETITISGQFQSKGTGFTVKIKQGWEYLTDNMNSLFKLNFHINRMTFQLQHATLDWINEHKLFDILIANPQFERETVMKTQAEYKFR